MDIFDRLRSVSKNRIYASCIKPRKRAYLLTSLRNKIADGVAYMKTILETCVPRNEVLSGELRDDMFAARLKDVIEKKADPIYGDPQTFFDNTFITNGLKTLVNEVLGRLSGKEPHSSPFIRLETSFGGGKTHNLIALYHLAMGHRDASPDNLVDPSWIPDKPWKIAGIVGSDLDPSIGLDHGEVTAKTLWGEMGWQLGGKEGYELFGDTDRTFVSPGTQALEKLVGDEPTLILIDELARFCRVARAVSTENEKSDLAEQTIAFLLSLFEFVVSSDNVVLVISLADSSDAFGRETEEIRRDIVEEAKRLSAREELVITPTGETEISKIVCHRMFDSVDMEAGKETAKEYAQFFEKLQDQGMEVPSRALRGEYEDEIQSDYPFHPELLSALNRKTATIPNFQKTRGALRLLARVVRNIWETKPDDAYLIHIHHLNLGLDEIANDLTSRLERPVFRSVIEADISSPKAGSLSHCQVIDKNLWEAAGKPPYAKRIATTVFLHSLTQSIATGVEPADMYLAAIQPGDDPQHLRKTLSVMIGEERIEPGMACWYLDWDTNKYRFKTEPGLEMIIQQELSSLGIVRTKNELDERIKRVWKKGIFHPIYFPQEAVDLPDDSKEPKLAVIHYDAEDSSAGSEDIPDLVRKLFDKSGTLEQYRSFKNNVLFLVADEDRTERMQDVMARLLGISRIVSDSDRMMEFSQDQRKRLHDMRDAAELDVRVAITRAYRFLYYPSPDGPESAKGLSCYELPAQDQGQIQQDQSTVVLKALQQIEKIVTADSNPLSAAYVKSKAWPHGQESMTTEDLRKEFCRRIGLRIILDPNQLKKTIRLGAKHGTWIYYSSENQTAYGPDTKEPFIQFSDDHILYTEDEAKKIHIWPPKQEDYSHEPCPLCGKYPCECEIREPIPKSGKLHAKISGVPAQAFQAIADSFADGNKELVGRLVVKCEGSGSDIARDIRILGLAIPQLPKGVFKLDLNISCEYADENKFHVNFSGSWDRYKRLKQIVDAFTDEASKARGTIQLTAEYSEGLSTESGLEQVSEILSSMDLGKVFLEAEEA